MVRTSKSRARHLPSAGAIAAIAGLSLLFAHGCGSDDDAATSKPGASTNDAATPNNPRADGSSEASTEIDAGPCLSGAPQVPALAITPVSTATFSSGVFAAQAPGSDDWYIVEQGGIVKIVRAGQVLATPFLDIQGAMGTDLGERGLLSIAFHPGYAQNGRFFVMGTPGTGANGDFAPSNADAVVEFRRSSGNRDVAEPAKVRDIVVLPTSAENHNGGTAAFGPDGKLYVGTGDGGGGCESNKPGTAQDPKSLFGKILRLDVDKAAPFAADGNPFTDDARVYHYGLRNPFRWNFDSLTGDLFIGDVGQEAYEEVSVAPRNAAGQNFGWPAFEGEVGGTCRGKNLTGPSPHVTAALTLDRRDDSTSPFADYQSVIGGIVYRGSAIPSLFGVYMFGDHVGAAFGFLRHCDGRTQGSVAVAKSQIPTPNGRPGSITAFAEGHDHEIYVLYGFGNARLGKLVAP